MSVERKTVIVKNKQGLHARPAALFVQVANKFDSRVTVIYNNERVNGKSIMGILMLGAEQGTEIIIEADGKDAQEVACRTGEGCELRGRAMITLKGIAAAPGINIAPAYKVRQRRVRYPQDAYQGPTRSRCRSSCSKNR